MFWKIKRINDHQLPWMDTTIVHEGNMFDVHVNLSIINYKWSLANLVWFLHVSNISTKDLHCKMVFLQLISIDVTFSFWKMPPFQTVQFSWKLYLGIVYFFFFATEHHVSSGFFGIIPAWGPEVLEDDEDSCLSAGNVTGTLGPRSWEVIDEKVYMDVKWVYEVNGVWTYYHLVHYIYTYTYTSVIQCFPIIQCCTIS